MDQAARGASALSSKDFDAAIKHYTDAIAQNAAAVDYYIKRSTAHTRTSPPDYKAALSDSEKALVLANKRAKRELITQAQLRRAIALSGLERYADALQCISWVLKLDEKEKTAVIWELKTKAQLRKLEEGDERAKVSVSEIPDIENPAFGGSVSAVQSAQATNNTPSSTNSMNNNTNHPVPVPQPQGVLTPPNKIRHDWMQTNENVIVSLYCKGIPKDRTTVEIKDSSLDVSFPLPTGSDYHFSLDPLFATINRMKSHYKIMSTKAEFTLAKARQGQKWPTVESKEIEEKEANKSQDADPSNDSSKTAAVSENTKSNVGPSYPTSSKSGPKNWDKLASDLSKRPKKDPKEGEEDEMEDPGPEEEEGDPTNNFFKTLYAGADADTKRAMMKSYQESNGTALSTNWAEVGKGPVETSPPEGMVAKKWGE